MANKNIVVVFGATGAQGGSVARAILEDPKTNAAFEVRAITRDPSKPAAKELAEKGAEVVSADLNDKESVRNALEGAHSVFLVTQFWETARAEDEIRQGKAVADVAKEVGIQHFIFSSLTGTTELTLGKLDKIYHFDSKAEIEKYINEIGLPATFFLAGFYMSNLIPNMMLSPNAEGAYTLGMPVPATAPFPLLATGEDTGKFVKAILLNRDRVLGKRILGATAYYEAAQIIEEFKEVKPEAGKSAQFVRVPDEAFKAYLGGAKGFLGQADGLNEVMQEEMLQNFRLMSEGGYYGGEGLEESHSILSEPLTTWKEYVAVKLPDVQ